MANYYELLQVPSTATAEELDAACTSLYNKWRRLVTHHVADIRNQATQALEQLEGIRATLSDPTARAAYDAGIGLKGNIGGLADPDAVLAAAPAMAAPVMIPPTVRLSGNGAATSAAPRPSLWTCPKKSCGAENPPNTKHCLQCGTQLVRECPECGKMASLVATGYCGECGFHYDVAVERAETKAKGVEQDGLLQQQQSRLLELRAERSKVNIGIGTPGLKLSIFLVLGIAVGAFAGTSSTLEVGIVVFLAVLFIGIWFYLLQQSNLLKARKLDSVIASQSQEADQLQQSIRALQAHYEQLGSQKAG